MDIKISSKFKKNLADLNRKNKTLVVKINKQLILFSQNPAHPSLRTHKLSGNLSNSWSISVDRNFRMVYTISADKKAYFYKLGTHEEVYRRQ